MDIFASYLATFEQYLKNTPKDIKEAHAYPYRSLQKSEEPTLNDYIQMFDTTDNLEYESKLFQEEIHQTITYHFKEEHSFFQKKFQNIAA